MVVCAKSAFQAGLHNGSKCLYAQHTGQLCCPDPVSGKVPQLTHTCLCDDPSNNNPARSTKTPKTALETGQDSTFDSNILFKTNKQKKQLDKNKKSDLNLPVVCRSFTRMLMNSFLFVFLPLAPSCCLYIPSPPAIKPSSLLSFSPKPLHRLHLLPSCSTLRVDDVKWPCWSTPSGNVIANSCVREEPTWIPLQQDFQSVSDLLMSFLRCGQG